MASRILAINDSQSILDLFRLLLTDEGYEVALYTDPDQAVADLEQVKPELIILDWLFGQEDLGRQILQCLKLNPSTAAIPVVVGSAGIRMVREVEEYLRAKGVAVVYKPSAIDDLLSVITTALQVDTAPGARTWDGDS